MFQRRAFLQAAATGWIAAYWQTTHGAVAAAEPAIRRLSIDPTSGGARAVIVGPVPLLHTPQVYAWDQAGRIATGGRNDVQIATAWDRLVENLSAGGAKLTDLVRLHVYAINDDIAARVRQRIEDQLPVEHRPAVTYVTGGLSQPQAIVAFDAVAVCQPPARPSAPVTLVPSHVNGARSAAGGRSSARQAILPPGRKLYISGQAEKGASLRECTRATMATLKQTLEMFNLGMQHVVQTKSFLTPITGVADAEDEIARFFPTDQLPPSVYVEWKSTLPIEIELIAAVPEGTSAAVEFHTPKWMTASPIFSRVALTNSPTTIYTSGLYGKSGAAEEQVRDLFAQLQQIGVETDSDLKHLVKATYYVANDETSGKLNAVRPDFYDPQRPPAASKAMVKGVGLAGRGITFDLIAVPRR